MIDFTSSQLSWLLIGACSIGGTGYVTLDTKVNELDKKLAITINVLENTNKHLEVLTVQLSRIEEKIENNNRKR